MGLKEPVELFETVRPVGLVRLVEQVRQVEQDELMGLILGMVVEV